jgi:predicted transposase/invertase (TIGR01784 family)
MQISRDTLWKGIIEDLFEDFLLYFYPNWAINEVDFSRRFEFLDKELDEIYTNSNNEKRYADKLVKVYLKNGQSQWVLIHIEVQGYADMNFSARMFTYFYRIRDRWQKEIMALAILTDNKSDFLPQAYEYTFQNTKLKYEFDIFKLLNKTEFELDKPQNPFSIVMLTAQKALQKKSLSDAKMFEWKIGLVRKLHNEGYSSEKIRRILNFIRFYVRFKDELATTNFEKELVLITKNRKNMGIEEAILQEVTEKALEKSKIETIEEMLKDNMGYEQITKYVKVPLEYVKQIAEKMIK